MIDIGDKLQMSWSHFRDSMKWYGFQHKFLDKSCKEPRLPPWAAAVTTVCVDKPAKIKKLWYPLGPCEIKPNTSQHFAINLSVFCLST